LFFSHAAPTPPLFPLSLHDALPIFLLSLLPIAEIQNPGMAPWVFATREELRLLHFLRSGGRKAVDEEHPAWRLEVRELPQTPRQDRKSTRLNSSHQIISYAVFCLKK